MFARFADAAIVAVIAEEWRRRERPDGVSQQDAEPPVPYWVSYHKGLNLVFEDDFPY